MMPASHLEVLIQPLAYPLRIHLPAYISCEALDDGAGALAPAIYVGHLVGDPGY